MAPEVVYKDSDFIILNKPANLLVHERNNASGAAEPTLVEWLVNEFPEVRGVGEDPINRPGIVHRLDKETSGAMVVARNTRSFEYLKNLFKTSQVKKNYLALALGRFASISGIIEKPIGLKSGTTKRTTRIDGAKLVKEAKTYYQVLNSFSFQGQELSLVGVRPFTGRTHQVRVHLNSIGHPVIGDQLYGGRLGRDLALNLGLKRQFLHSESIEFTAPGGSRVKVSVNLPEDLEQALSLLRAAPEDRRSRS